MKKNKIVLLLIIVVITICGCSNNKTKEKLLDIDYDIKGNELKLDKYETNNPVVALYIKNYGSVIIELYPEIAPNTVNNFISLIKSGFYDNNTFHRLVPGFVLQGGDPTATGVGGPGYSIKGEFENNGFKNDLKHTKGIVSMARGGYSNDSAGSQFFIMLEDAPYLDKDYAAFGKVIDGFDIIEKIEKEERIINQDSGQLQNKLILKKALVDTKDKEYNDVIKIKN